VLVAVLLLAARTHVEKLTIGSTPPEATVEIDGAAFGATPYEIAYPGEYFQKAPAVFGTTLEHAILLDIYKTTGSRHKMLS
jgi:hypothetical protein